MNFQMFKLVLEKAEEPEIKLPDVLLDHRKSKRVPEKHLFLLYWLHQSLWLCRSTICGKFLKRREYQTPYLPPEKPPPVCRSRSNSYNWTWNNRLVPNRKRSIGCILSPCSFNLYAEYITQNAGLDKAQAGIKIAGRNINSLRHADDTTLIAESEELKSLLMQVKKESEKAGLKLTIQKTKIMASGPVTWWQIDGETVETVRDLLFWVPKSLQMVTAAWN